MFCYYLFTNQYKAGEIKNDKTKNTPPTHPPNPLAWQYDSCYRGVVTDEREV
jgi:hypothetical protein